MTIKYYLLILILLSSITYADTWDSGSTFSPPLTNVTYSFNDDVTLLNLTVNETCLILEFEQYTDLYCDTSPIPEIISLSFTTITTISSTSYGLTNLLSNFTVNLTDSNTSLNYSTTLGKITLSPNILNNFDTYMTINVDSNENGGYLSRNYINQYKNVDLNAFIWQSEIHVNIFDSISGSLVDSSTVNNLFNGYSMSDVTNGSILYMLDTGEYFINSTHPFYLDSLTSSGNISAEQIISINISLINIFNFSFFREQTGDPFNFIEDELPYSCSNSTNNITNYLQQEDADDITCVGEFNPDHVCIYGYDNIPYTYAKSNSTNPSYIIQSYNKLLNTTNESKIQIQKDLFTFENFTLPINCYNQNPILINSTSDSVTNNLTISCYNGASYELISTYNNGGMIYDNNIFWSQDATEPNITTCTNTTQVSFEIDIFCPTKKVTNIINNSNQGVLGIDCDYDYWLVKAVYSTTSYYRTVIPDKTISNHDIYLLDLNYDDAIEVIIKVIDISDEYSNGQIKLTTFIKGEEKTVIHQLLDIENKVTLWLDLGQVYKIYAIKNDGTEEYVGDLIADQATTKILTFPTIPLIDNTPYFGNQVYWNYDASKTTGIISLNYFDVSPDGFKSLEWKIFDDDAQIFIYNHTELNGFNLTLNVTGLDSHTSYMSVLMIDHNNRNSKINEVRPLWLASATVFGGWGTTDANGVNPTSETIKLVIATIFPVMIILLFSAGTIEVGMIAGILFIYIFNLYNWYAALPYWPGIVNFIIPAFIILTIGRIIQKIKKR